MTLSALKRELRPGMRLRVTDHWQPKYNGTVRTVTRTQTNGYWYSQPGEDQECFSPLEGARYFSYPSESSYRYSDGQRYWQLEIIQPARREGALFAYEVTT